MVFHDIIYVSAVIIHAYNNYVTQHKILYSKGIGVFCVHKLVLGHIFNSIMPYVFAEHMYIV